MVETAVATATAPARPSARTSRVVVVAVVTLTLVGGGAAGALVWQHRGLVAAEETAAARATVSSATLELERVAAPARRLLAESAGRVADEGIRSELRSALDEAAAAKSTDGRTVPELDDLARRIAAARKAVESASAAVTAAVGAWELGEAEAGYATSAERLASVLTSARATWQAAAGRVADDAVRVALASAVEAAQGLLDEPAPRSLERLRSGAASLDRAADSLAGPTAAVETAVDAWEAARAAEAAAAQAASSAASHPSTPPRRSSSGAGSGTSTDGSHWEETVTYDDGYSVCGDEQGNWWWC